MFTTQPGITGHNLWHFPSPVQGTDTVREPRLRRRLHVHCDVHDFFNDALTENQPRQLTVLLSAFCSTFLGLVQSFRGHNTSMTVAADQHIVVLLLRATYNPTELLASLGETYNVTYHHA